MRPHLSLLLALLLSACASMTAVDTTPPQPNTYLWLSQPGLEAGDARMRYREQFDVVLRQRGFSEGAHPSLALSIATDARASRERDVGYGIYSGGFSYFSPQPAPDGYVEVIAFDVTSMRPAWRARWLADAPTAEGAAFEMAKNSQHPPHPRGRT
jgi:hypothetical protein